MKHRKYTLNAACLCASAGMLCTALPVTAAEDLSGAKTGSVTVTVYDGETGELFDDPRVFVEIVSGKYTKKPKYGSFFSHSGFYPAESNPGTVSDIPLRENYTGFFDLALGSIYTEEPYYYEIDEERSGTAFNFDESTEQTAVLYLVKKYDDGAVGGFWIYHGQTEDGQYPVFTQFYPDKTERNGYAARRIQYQGETDMQLSYGDLLLTDTPVNINNGVLTDDVTWQKIANCHDLPDIRTVTVGSRDTSYPIWIQDAEGNDFRYTPREKLLRCEISMKDAQCGDTLQFAFYEGIPVLPLTEPEHHHPAGDASGDNLLNNADLTLLGDYLLSKPDTVLKDWKAADLNSDGILSAADLTLLKQELRKQAQKPHCTLTLTTTQDGYSVAGERLSTRKSTENFIVYEGDYFGEGQSAWFQNDPHFALSDMNQTAVIEKITEDSVTIRFNNDEGEKETVTLAYGQAQYRRSRFVVFDDYNSTYTLIFSDYSADGITRRTPPEKLPVIEAETDSVTANECTVLWDMLAAKYPQTDLSDFTLRYDPDHQLSGYVGGKMFRILYKGILIHSYEDGNTGTYAYYAKNNLGEIRADANFPLLPEQLSKLELPEKYLSAAELKASDTSGAPFDTEPELCIYLSQDPAKAPQLAYRLAENHDFEIIFDAVTGEVLERISYVVP